MPEIATVRLDLLRTLSKSLVLTMVEEFLPLVYPGSTGKYHGPGADATTRQIMISLHQHC